MKVNFSKIVKNQIVIKLVKDMKYAYEDEVNAIERISKRVSSIHKLLSKDFKELKTVLVQENFWSIDYSYDDWAALYLFLIEIYDSMNHKLLYNMHKTDLNSDGDKIIGLFLAKGLCGDYSIDECNQLTEKEYKLSKNYENYLSFELQPMINKDFTNISNFNNAIDKLCK